MKWKICLITFILFFQIFVLAAKADIILGSGVNITNGTIIRLSGLNCNITARDNYVVNKLEVYPTFFLMNVSEAPTFIYNLPYSFRNGIINITGSNDSALELKLNKTYFGNGIKIYEISGFLTSLEWSEENKMLFFTINAPSGTNSTSIVYWPYELPPKILCIYCLAYSSSFNSTSKILILNATHSSPITWSLQVQTPTTTTAGGGGGGGGGIIPSTTTTTTLSRPNITTTSIPTTTTLPLITTTTIPEKKEKEQLFLLVTMLLVFVVILVLLIVVWKKWKIKKEFEKLKEKWEKIGKEEKLNL